MAYLLAELILVVVLGFLAGAAGRRHLRRAGRRPEGERCASGTFLGSGPLGPLVLPDEAAGAHVLVLGATGSGKTTTLLRFVASALERGIALIMVDGKADPGLAVQVAEMARSCGRRFRHFDMTRPDRSAPYNPLRRGSVLEIRDRLMASSDWSEPHYKFAAARYLAEGIALVRSADGGGDLPSLVEALEPHRLALLARSLAKKEDRLAVHDLIDRCGREAGGLLNRLAACAPRETAALLREDPEAIDLEDAWEKGETAFFSLDSLGYPEQARLLGRLFVLDLKAAVSRMLARGCPVFVVLDEFGVLAGQQVADLLNKSRAAGMHLVLAAQELADLRAGGGQSLLEQILGNTNVKIVHRQDVPASAELLAACVGRREGFRFHLRRNHRGVWQTNALYPDRPFWIEPDEIKRLARGDVVVLVKHPAFQVVRVHITPVGGGGGLAVGLAV